MSMIPFAWSYEPVPVIVNAALALALLKYKFVPSATLLVVKTTAPFAPLTDVTPP